jgi:hypothetical protein
MDIAQVVAEVRESGFSVCEGFLSEDRCKQARASIDKLIMNYPSAVSLTSSDSRIFGSEFLSKCIRRDFYDDDFVNEILCQLYGIDNLEGRTILAQHVKPIPGNTGSGGVWHRDSLPDQYKAFLYFNEITDTSGPLQLFPKTHKTVNKVIASFKRGRKWNSLDHNSEVSLHQVVGQGASELSITGKLGSLIFVNTSILHRGKPGLESERYSATYYAFKTSLPPHINELVVKSKLLS